MFEDFEYKGLWFKPETPDRKIHGILKFIHNERITLELVGSFESIESLFSGLAEYEIVLGLSGNIPITLYNAIEIKRALDHGQMVSVLVINFVLIGEHFNQASEIAFSRVSFGFTYLEEWLAKSPFTQELKYESNSHIIGAGKETLREATVKYEPPVPQEVRLNKIKSNLTIVSTLQIKEEPLRLSMLRHSTFLTVAPDSKREFNFYQNMLRDLENFLTLLMGSPVYPTFFRAYGDDTIVVGGKNIRKEIQIFYILNRAKAKKQVDIGSIFISFDELGSNFSNCIRNWFNKADKLKPVTDLLMGTLYMPEIYREFHFLALT